MSQEKTYDPFKKVVPEEELDDLIMYIIDRHPEDQGVNWQTRERLIENVLCRDEAVANCAVDFDGKTVYVALTGEKYSVEQFEEIDTRLRRQIGLVATFDFYL